MHKSSHPMCAKTHTKFASSGRSIQPMFSATTPSARGESKHKCVALPILRTHTVSWLRACKWLIQGKMKYIGNSGTSKWYRRTKDRRRNLLGESGKVL